MTATLQFVQRVITVKVTNTEQRVNR